MEAVKTSEVFERAARREVSPEQAASTLLKNDAELRKQQVAAARPGWMPRVAWAFASVIIVALIDFLQRRS
ncbi:MAG: hypothetical protein SFV15_05785 [Polyangiaceae bacterium]|nr:hypothetical protein [Polyangiaceae bacterium]